MAIESVNAPVQLSVSSQVQQGAAQVGAGTVEQEAPVSSPAPKVVETPLSVEKLEKAIEQINEFMKSGDRSLNFSVDNSTEEVVVRVIDSSTDEVIRQIPTEESLKFAEYLEGMVGLLFDEKV